VPRWKALHLQKSRDLALAGDPSCIGHFGESGFSPHQ
jgi:hypothetical protein